MATTSNKCSAADVFRTHCEDLLSAIPEPDSVAWKLFSERIISEDTLDEVHVEGQTDRRKNSIILKAVKRGITYEVLEKFATVLNDYHPANKIAAEIHNDIVRYNLVAKGMGKKIAIGGQMATFELTTTHSVPLDPNLLSCQLTAPNSYQPVQCTITPTQPGSCNVHYTPSVRGPHQLKITVKGKDTPDGPFTVHVLPSPEMRGYPLNTITGLNKPYGVVVSESGEVVVSESEGHCISVFSTERKKIWSFGSKGSGRGEFHHPHGIALTHKGHLLVVDKYNHRLQEFTLEGKFVTSLGQKEQRHLKIEYPYGITVHQSGMMFLTEPMENRIHILNPDLSYSHMFSIEGDGQQQSFPSDVACDSHGYVYVTDSNNYRVLKFTSDGQFISSFSRAGSLGGQRYEPEGICIDSTDAVYVSEYDNHLVSMFDCKGQFLKCFGQGEEEGKLYNPCGLAVDNTGNLYVCDSRNDRVVIY